MFVSRLIVVCSKRIIGPLVAALALLALTGCSAVKLAYNNAPEFSHWWIDRYVDLDDTQSDKVKDGLQQLQRWHRRAELPKIADLLQRAHLEARANGTPEQLCSLFAEVRLRADAVVAQAEPAYVALAMDLKPQQIANIEARFRKTNKEWREEWIEGGTEQRLKRRMKSAQERGEDFYGRLDDAQEAVLRNALARSDFDPDLNYRERVRRQQDLLQTLRRTSNLDGGTPMTVAQAAEALRGYLERSVKSPNPVYRAWADKAIQDGCRTVAELHNSTTAEQRERAARRLNAYQRSLRELAADH